MAKLPLTGPKICFLIHKIEYKNERRVYKLNCIDCKEKINGYYYDVRKDTLMQYYDGTFVDLVDEKDINFNPLAKALYE